MIEQTGLQSEVYSNRANPAYDAVLQQRSAEAEGAFFLPYLRPGMRLLDCGCGPGTITAGLARRVAPGNAVGVDIDGAELTRAREHASAATTATLDLAAASVYSLPFRDGSFDAAFVHTVLVHLRDPLAALREVRRVLKPGGVLGVADGDWGTELIAPPLPSVARLHELQVRVRRHNGGDPFYARNLRRLLHEAGFARSEAGARVYSAGIPAALRAYAGSLVARFAGPAFRDMVLNQGWANIDELERVCDELVAWSKRPDAFYAITTCTAVAWAPEE
ncbi:MAG TPA: methyltransferase domain-containing protein [Dehalococcoidia bacterium]|jgi:SAM-dependent methyltransferase|nr:methyltransferase domain-containing protein [Dehalococcoidia bacterium]